MKEINLPESTTEDELVSHLYALKGVHGIQLMWPLPPHINPKKVYTTISADRGDVDGAHYVGLSELGGKHSPLAPITPLAVLNLMDHYNIDTKNKEILVVGRSRIVGSPLAYMLRERGAIATVAHSDTSSNKLESFIQSADIVISCASFPGLLRAEWVDINVGTTFREDTLPVRFILTLREMVARMRRDLVQFQVGLVPSVSLPECSSGRMESKIHKCF